MVTGARATALEGVVKAHPVSDFVDNSLRRCENRWIERGLQAYLALIVVLGGTPGNRRKEENNTVVLRCTVVIRWESRVAKKTLPRPRGKAKRSKGKRAVGRRIALDLPNAVKI